MKPFCSCLAFESSFRNDTIGYQYLMGLFRHFLVICMGLKSSKFVLFDVFSQKDIVAYKP